ncbi:MAG TPA: prenyltransferase/squalene oxidase repeat-containing protein [Bryobacteraceae bacterium]|jgi:squalene-hopene/tetraprenyl-beta-curcumene cyclase|nr:prenyltransferase/squalene oxidase repeat-containing protein [Bryobacteraceae bacterium]
MAENATLALLARRSPSGAWEGRLSSSALSTATAVIALSFEEADASFVSQGRAWLIATQNEDGGWGDTTASLSNISTTALCWAALLPSPASMRAEGWLSNAAGSIEPHVLKRAIVHRYGKDRTFSVPILTALAIGGRLGQAPDLWRMVPQLPFELAACPHRWFQWLQLPVVSYALPALIAIGLARHRRLPSRNPLARFIRWAIEPRVMSTLERIQPTNGGFLEATPLTSFVAMSLIAAGLAAHPVTQKCLAFLRASIREDGSWPIDTNLSTWITTLAIDGLADVLPDADRAQLRDWLLSQQFQDEHPYTHAAPGGWSWTNLPGAVPDADDTAGALIALRNLGNMNDQAREAARKGVCWLLDLQNRDGGIPTFLRGWGHLPFDRSGPDLTAHAIRAWRAWLPELPDADRTRVSIAIRNALRYLQNSQQPDGSWIPLWFGNQHAPREENRTFGTARVILALCDADTSDAMLRGAVDWLIQTQNADGGWGGAANGVSSIEETALAARSLARVIDTHPRPEALRSAVDWLRAHTSGGAAFPPTPIGFYFASLWYFEDLYPLVFTVAALRRIPAKLHDSWQTDCQRS